jgi:hypothetical protein
MSSEQYLYIGSSSEEYVGNLIVHYISRNLTKKQRKKLKGKKNQTEVTTNPMKKNVN